MDTSPNKSPRKRLLQFRLRTMLLLMGAVCVLAYVDPFGWKPPSPVPIKTVEDGDISEVDLIELNHRQFDTAERSRYRYRDDHFDQLLFWSIHPDGELHLREWRIIKGSSMLPKLVHGKWVCTWMESGIERRIEAPSFRETASKSATNDPELLDRQSLPREKRTSLWSSADRTLKSD